MINFKDIFRFSQTEVFCLFENATIKSSWRGLKLLQTPLDCFGSTNFYGKLLIITPRISGKAYQRNLFRRRIKNIFYSNKLYLYPANSILIAYKNAMDYDFDHLEKFLIKNFTQNSQSNKKKLDPDCSQCQAVMPVKLWQRLVLAIFDVMRPLFGFIGSACIYPVSCSDYAKHMICTKPFYKSIPLIIFRVLSCNPLTAIFIRWKNNRIKK